MITDLCELMERKMGNLSVREKTEIFIGSIHLQKEPIIGMMFKMIDKIPYSEFASSAMSFFKNKDHFLQKEQNVIKMTDTGRLP